MRQNRTEHSFRGRIRPKNTKVDATSLIALPHERMAFVYQRLSSHEQMRRSIYSIAMQDALQDLAKEDGYYAPLSAEEIETVKDDPNYPGYYLNGQIYVEQRDLGISGTLGQDRREGLASLIKMIETTKVESVYVVHISRLFRDQTLIDGLSFGELCKESGVVIVMPNVRLNLSDKMHMRLYRMELERAADELDLMKSRLLGARDMKARRGYYVGGSIPPGFVLDMDEKIEGNGVEVPNPNYQKYRVWEPHAKVVRVIFDKLTSPGMGQKGVVDYCRSHGIVFPPFPEDITRVTANEKAFIQSGRNSDGSYPVGVDRVKSIATNPAYIGWWVYGGEVISADNHPRIIDDETFWIVQEKFSNRTYSPKKDNPPLPLAGLLYCGKHEIPRRVSYMSGSDREGRYLCRSINELHSCWHISSHILDQPISELVISQCSFQELTDKVVEQLRDEYKQAKERVASFEREFERLSREIENLEANFCMEHLTQERATWIEAKIKEKMEQRAKLTRIENQRIGKVVGPQGLSEKDIDLVRSFLANLKDGWGRQPNELKNAFLSLVLDRVVVYPNRETIRVKLFWQIGLEQEILIDRPFVDAQKTWTHEEEEILKAQYADMPRDKLLELLPGRSWDAISYRARAHLGLCRRGMMGTRGWNKEGKIGKHWSEGEDEILRKHYRGEIGKEEVLALLGKSYTAIRVRACKLGVKREETIRWELVSNNVVAEKEPQSGVGLAAPR